MDLAVILALVTVAVAVVAVWRAALTLAAVAFIAMAAVIPAAQATTVLASDSTPTAEPSPTTTTTAAAATPPESTTTTTSKSATTTTTSATTTTTTTATQAVSPVRRAQQVEAIADESGWNWRGAGVVIHVAFHPQECCHWGVYDYRDSSLWIGPTAFADTTRLRYVVLHELGHAWQWHSGHLDALAADMVPWGHRGSDGLEAGADCVSVVWGASAKAGHYWSCPPAAAARVGRRLAGDWT